MNIQQLKYALAVEETKHFEQAAEKCFVTQSTLSTMIGKLESELDIKLFDRKTKPVSVTKEGEKLINQFRIILKEIETLETMAQELKGETVGELRIGIIPTIAPYLLPSFLIPFAKNFPKIKISVREMPTRDLQQALHQRKLDIGIAAIPLEDNDLIEYPLYTEPFLLYDRNLHSNDQGVSIEDIDMSKLWLLQEGHCMRTQVEHICNLSSSHFNEVSNLEFKAGSIDSLIRFTRVNQGVTLLPLLAIQEFEKEELQYCSRFSPPVPVRSVGMIIHKHFVKKKLLKKLQIMIQQSMSKLIEQTSKEHIVHPLKEEK